MFGIIRPCQHRLSGELHADWVAHLCGLCLALRGEHGQLARTATNYDGLVISVLVEAQSPGADSRRNAGPCPLRGMRRASVADGEGSRLAASVSLLLASAKLRDHADDGDGALRHGMLAGLARSTAGRWADRGGTTATRVGFDTTVLVDAVERQSEVEHRLRPGDPVLAATEPTETATAAAFAHTAVLAGAPANVEPLAEAGRFFGRIAHLLDAVQDLHEDAATGAWNPLTVSGTSLAEARRLCDQAVQGVRLALGEVDFTRPALVHALLVHELRYAVHRVFGHAGEPEVSSSHRAFASVPPEHNSGGGCWLPRFHTPPRRRGFFLGCLLVPYQCCTCQYCCRDPWPGPWSGEPHSTDCVEGCGEGCGCTDRCCSCCD